MRVVGITVLWHAAGTARTEQVMAHRDESAFVLAEAVRAACQDAAMRAYEDAGIRGLCADGRWEAAIAAIGQLDLSHVVETSYGSTGDRQEAGS